MLRRAIESVLAQTFKDFELLVLDNSSTDDTEKVTRSFEDARIRYIKHPKMGISGARNLALRESEGEYLAFLDDDDEWLPNKLEDEYAVFAKDTEKKIGLVYGAYVHINQKTGKVFETIYPKRRGNVYEYAVTHEDTLTGSASNPMLRKEAVIAVGGYDEAVPTGEDYEMFLRLAKQYEFDYIEQPVLKIYVHGGYRLSYQVEPYIQTELIVYKKHFDLIRKYPRVQAHYLEVIAGRYLRIGKPKEARQYLRQALEVRPMSVIAYAQFILSYLPKKLYLFLHALVIRFVHFIRRHS
jgi:glycosyltransferase involved in cell wall biosynthesis